MPSDILGGFIPHARFLTTMILVINFGLYAASTLYSIRGGHELALDLDGPTLYLFGGKLRSAILQGEWWRLITAGFLHGGLFHIAMNSWVLFDLGAQVEEIFGARRFITIYFASTVLGFVASAWWFPGLSIGSSAGVFGLIGAMIAMGMSSNTAMGAAIKGMYIRWALYGLLIGLLPFFPVDNAAHVGGLIGGFVTAWLAGTPRLFDDWREKLWGAAAIVSLALTAFAFLMMFLNLSAAR